MESPHENEHRLTPKFFFLSLGVLVTLITVVVAFLNLVFETLNNKFPDALDLAQLGSASYSSEGMKSSIATLLIIFPVYLALSYFWRKASNTRLTTINAVIRRWMIYLVLFLSAIVVVVDLITLVRYFVSGEITVRFILKVVSALVAGGAVGSYYIWELLPKASSKILPLSYAIVSSVLILATIIWSFSVIGSPSQQRMQRFDDIKVNDLQSIQWSIISYWQQKERLPVSLVDLANPITNYYVPLDPEGIAYEYSQTGDLSFELCTNFSLPSVQQTTYKSDVSRPTPSDTFSYSHLTGNRDSWDHESGRTCFNRTIDKDLYPPTKDTLNTF